MALSIRSKHVEVLARRLAEETGENITEVILSALMEKAARLQQAGTEQKIDELLARVARLPIKDPRSADAVIGYDDNGTFGGR